MISIEDPCDPKNDVGKVSYAMDAVKGLFSECYQQLTTLHPKPKPWNRLHKKMGESMLNRILTVGNMVVDRRVFFESWFKKNAEKYMKFASSDSILLPPYPPAPAPFSQRLYIFQHFQVPFSISFFLFFFSFLFSFYFFFFLFFFSSFFFSFFFLFFHF